MYWFRDRPVRLGAGDQPSGCLGDTTNPANVDWLSIIRCMSSGKLLNVPASRSIAWHRAESGLRGR
jgi:hypothetical protein